MTDFHISDVRIVPVHPVGGLVAFASCIINNKLYLGSIAIHEKLDGSGLRLTYPTKKAGTQNLTIFHPVEPYLSKAMEQAIFAEYERLYG